MPLGGAAFAVFKTWVTLKVDWSKVLPEAKLGPWPLDLAWGLMPLDMGWFFKKLITGDVDRAKYGFMPMLAVSGNGQLGTLNDGNILLANRHLEMMVVLRMNRTCMEFMREHYFEEIKAKQPFNSDGRGGVRGR
jgi:hypothetical protein